jgi:hypothetical protein
MQLIEHQQTQPAYVTTLSKLCLIPMLRGKNDLLHFGLVLTKVTALQSVCKPAKQPVKL